ncbi:MAG: putative glycoside hydrolase [Desulfomonilia bacterium]
MRAGARWMIAFTCCIMIIPLCAQANVTYTVKSGDTLAKIAAQYFPLSESYTKGEFVDEIKKLNNIGIKGLSPGQVLTIPVVRTEPVKPRSVKRPKTFKALGLYANQWTAGSRQVLSISEQIKKYGANTMVFDAKEVQGLPTYKSAVQQQYTGLSSYNYSIKDIAKLVDYLHKKNIHVVSRVCMFKDLHNSSANQKWRFDKDWVNPANKTVQEYNLAIIRELMGFGVDEIQIDYFRYPTDGKANTGIEGKSRSDVLTEYAARIHELTSSNGVLLSLDMFGIVNWLKDEDIRTLGQDVRKLKDHFDIISPMLYPSHFPIGFSGEKNPADKPYYFVSRGIIRMKALVGDRVTIRPWLQSFPLRITIGYNPAYIESQIKAAEDSGSVGWLLWSPGNHYDEAYRAMDDLARQRKANTLNTSQAKQ